MGKSSIDSVVHVLENEVKQIQEAISLLKGLGKRSSKAGKKVAKTSRKLSAQARKRISQAAKRRWAAVRAAKKKTAKMVK